MSTHKQQQLFYKTIWRQINGTTEDSANDTRADTVSRPITATNSVFEHWINYQIKAESKKEADYRRGECPGSAT